MFRPSSQVFQDPLLVVDLFHCCLYPLPDHAVLLSLLLAVLLSLLLSLKLWKWVLPPTTLVFTDSKYLLPMCYHQITLSISQPYRECFPTRQSGRCSNFNRVDEAVQIISEHQLRDYHHGLVQQCLQTLQCRLLVLVVLNITVLVAWLFKTCEVRGDQAPCHLRVWLGLGCWKAFLWLWWWSWLQDNNVFILNVLYGEMLTVTKGQPEKA